MTTTRKTGISMKKPQSVLLIDDDQGILETFKRLLSGEGVEVDAAETGKTALEMAETKKYDLAVIDVRLSDMQGTKLLSQLRKNMPATKKIIITGYPSLDNASESVNLHADAYLIKPVNPEEFLRVVREKLKEHIEDEKMTEQKVMDWVETRYLQAKHGQLQSTGKTPRRSQQQTENERNGAAG